MAKSKTPQEIIVSVHIYIANYDGTVYETIYAPSATSFLGPVQDILDHLETIKGVVADSLED